MLQNDGGGSYKGSKKPATQQNKLSQSYLNPALAALQNAGKKVATTGGVGGTSSKTAKSSTSKIVTKTAPATKQTTKSDNNSGGGGYVGASSGGGGGYSGGSDLSDFASMLNGLTGQSTYSPVDTKKFIDAVGSFDPHMYDTVYQGQYDSLNGMRTNAGTQYNSGKQSLSDLYTSLTNQTRDSAATVGQAYSQAADNIQADANSARTNIENDGQLMQQQRQALLSNLGIQAAAPALNESDGATLEGKNRITAAAGTQSNLADLLGANAQTYVQNVANNDNLAGANSQKDFLDQYNNYLHTLDGKQSDIDSAKASAIVSAQQDYNNALTSAKQQAVQFDFRNSENASNAAQAAQTNGLNTMNAYLNQTNTDRNFNFQQSQLAEQAAEAAAKAQVDAAAAQAKQSAAAAPKPVTGAYSDMNQLASQWGLDGQTTSNALALINAMAGKGSYNSAADFITALNKSAGSKGFSGNTLYALDDMANTFWKGTGARTVTPSALTGG